MKKVMTIAAVVLMSVGFYAVDTTNEDVKLYDVENATASDDEDRESGDSRNEA